MKSFYEYDISFGLVTPTGGLLKQLMVSIQIPQISKAFFSTFLPKTGIMQHGLCQLTGIKSTDPSKE